MDNINWEYQPYGSGSYAGGFVYADAGTGTKFEFDCPVPEDVTVDFAMGPPNGTSHTIGCNINNPTLTTLTYAIIGNLSGGWPTEILYGMATGANTVLNCGTWTSDGDGDGSLISYRLK